MADRFDSSAVEQALYKHWEEQGYFKPNENPNVRIMGNPDYKKIDGKKERYCYQKECRYEGGVQIQFDENGLLQETW